MVSVQTVRVADDAWVEVRSTGAGESLLLIQTALDPAALVPLSCAPRIAERFRIIDCRRRGYGASSPAGNPGSIVRDAVDCHAVLRALGCDRAHVLGTSYSGAVALELAATAPELVRTLTLVEPPPRHGPPANEFTAANAHLLGVFERDGVTQALEEFTRALGAPSWLAERADADPALVARIENDAATFFTADIPALMRWEFPQARSTEVECPVLYLGGAESPASFTHVRTWVKELFPECEDHLIPGAGHSLATTHSQQVSELLVDFLARHPT